MWSSQDRGRDRTLSRHTTSESTSRHRGEEEAGFICMSVVRLVRLIGTLLFQGLSKAAVHTKEKCR